jgi:agmatine deiminase
LTWTDDTSDPQYEISQEAYQILSSAVDAKGRKFEIHKVHQPDPLHVTREELDGMAYSSKTTGFEVGERMAASYINFYIANGVVVVPTFDDPVHDKAALQKIQEMFPERKVTGVPGREILLGGGNVHCITQQQPRV